MEHGDSELEAFKRLNLTAVAATMGYRVDFRASSQNSAVMVNPGGDKVIVAVDPDGHWVYFSVRDDRDHGSVIDFVQRRLGGTLGQVRQVLRPWIGGAAKSPRPQLAARSYVEKLEPLPRDLVSVRVRFESMASIDAQEPYLTVKRGVPSSLIAHPAIAESIRIDQRGNVCFAHQNDGGFCGYEIKNHGFTGFSSGGVKGLWEVGDRQSDRCLVVTETAIDALSYAAIHGIERTRLVSTAGQMNPEQPKLLRSAMELLPLGGRVVSAMDRDAGGDALTARVLQVFTELGRTDLQFMDHRPSTPGMDWNDELRAKSIQSGAPHLG